MKENIQQTALTKHFRALGTSISLTVFGTLDQTVLEKSADLVNHYEDVLTVNRDHSQLMSVNQAAGKFPVQVEASVYQLTKLAVEKVVQTLVLMLQSVRSSNCGTSDFLMRKSLLNNRFQSVFL